MRISSGLTGVAPRGVWQTPVKSVDSVENPGGAVVEPVDNFGFSVVASGPLCYHRPYLTRVSFPQNALENTCSGIMSRDVALCRPAQPGGFSTSSGCSEPDRGDLSTTPALGGTLFSTDGKARMLDGSPYAGSLRVSGGSRRKEMSTDVESSVDGPGKASLGPSQSEASAEDAQIATGVYRCLRIRCGGPGC
jgi:hypothetical protein